MKIPSETKIELPEMLYTYWEKIPIIQDLSTKVIDKLNKTKSQNLIISSLSKGIEDQISGETRIRHAMSAVEIKSSIAELYNFEINKSNLYYHLQKLIEQGIIKIITSVQKSNIVTSYYGRTSKLIFADVHAVKDESKKDKSKKKIKHQNSIQSSISSDLFIELLQNFSTDESLLKETKILIEKVKKTNSEYHREFMHWIINNEEKFSGLELNLLDVNYIYNQIMNYNDDMVALLKNLDDILKISSD